MQGTQPDTGSHHRPSGLITLAGLILGGVVGAVIGGVLVLVYFNQMTDLDAVPAAGIGVIIGLAFGIVIGAVIGSVVGALSAGWLSSRPGKVPVTVALSVVVLLCLIIYGSYLWTFQQAIDSQTQQVFAANRYAALNPQPPRQSTNIVAGPTGAAVQSSQPSTLPQQPVSTQAVPPVQDLPASAPPTNPQTTLDTIEQVKAAYGDLVYPNSTIVPSAQPMPRPDVPCAFENLTSSDTYDQAVSYYSTRLTTIRQSATEYLGSTRRSSDGRTTLIEVKLLNSTVYISISAS